MFKLAAPLLLLVLLAGCGAPRYFTIEAIDEAALSHTASYHAHPVEVEFVRPANWELKDSEWQEMLENGDQAFARGMLVVDRPAMFKIGKDARPDSGGVVDIKVTHLKRGHYTFFTWSPAIIDATVTITDAKSGAVIFKGFGQGITPERGGVHFNWEKAGDGGRIKGAHYDLGRKLAWTLQWYANQKK